MALQPTQPDAAAKPDLATQISWLPDWVLSFIVFGLAAVIALLAHSLLYRFLNRLSQYRGLFLRSLVSRTRALSRWGLVALALAIATSVAPLSSADTALAARALQVLFIALAGWVALDAMHIGSVAYTRRFKTSAPDNLLARRHVTQIKIIERMLGTLIVTVTLAAALMTIPSVRHFGVSLLASAGVAGIVLGLALQPIFTNLMAGLQIAITQPIRIDDAVVVEGEWGWIEEINSAYVVVRCWDLRRLILPVKYFIDHPFQNWTRESAKLIGSVYLKVDYTVPIEALRTRLKEIVQTSALWDKDVVNLQVTDATEHTVELRVIVSARNSGDAWDLRCHVREQLIRFLQGRYPEALPRQRAEIAHIANGSDSGALTPPGNRRTALS